MMIRTHLAIALLAVLLFFNNITHKTVFVIMMILATFLPDIDNGFSTLGKLQASKFVQFLVKHRGVLHSFTFCIIVSVLLAWFLPVFTLGFFLGYSVHLFADAFTVEGIKPYWPLKHKISWRIRTGGYTETSIFIFFLLADIFVLLFLVFNLV